MIATSNSTLTPLCPCIVYLSSISLCPCIVYLSSISLCPCIVYLLSISLCPCIVYLPSISLCPCIVYAINITFPMYCVFAIIITLLMYCVFTIDISAFMPKRMVHTKPDTGEIFCNIAQFALLCSRCVNSSFVYCTVNGSLLWNLVCLAWSIMQCSVICNALRRHCTLSPNIYIYNTFAQWYSLSQCQKG